MTWATATADAVGPWIQDGAVHRAVALIDGDETVIRVGSGVEREATFAIGSITKTMVATVLASLHLTEGLDLDTPVGGLLDVPANGDVTLRQLATHTSGLPRLAPDALDHHGFQSEDPYAAYSAELALAALADVERSEALANDAGAAYSNYGYQLLGLALEAASGADLPTLLRQRIFEPLDMAGACHRLAEPVRPQVTGRHRGQVVPRWNLLLGGPGGVECSIDDAARWARAVARPTDDPVGRAIALAADVRAPLAWMAASTAGWLWHDGGEAGADSMLIASPDSGRAAVALAAAHPDGLSDAIVDAVRSEQPPAPPSSPPPMASR